MVSDGLSGIKEAIKDEFPTCFFNRCVVHIDRNLYKITKASIKKDVMKDFKKIYTSNTLEEAEVYINEFLEKYKAHKVLINQ